jgi:hypothetical protein
MKKSWLLSLMFAAVGSLAFAQSDLTIKSTDSNPQRKTRWCHRGWQGLSGPSNASNGVAGRSFGSHGCQKARQSRSLRAEATPSLGSTRFDLTTSYTYSRPQQRMGDFIRQAHGLQVQGLYLVPKTPFAVGADIGYNLYGIQTTRQTYQFSDGSSTETDVRVSNGFFTFNLVGRADFFKTGTLIPYVMGKVGYNYYLTNLNIENPADPEGCKPLENKALFKDGAFSTTVGAGLRWDLGNVFKNAGKERFYADFSAHYTNGGSVNYMNVNIPADPNPVVHQHHSTATAEGVSSYNARFINPRTQVIHEHHVGDVYVSPIQLLEFKLGFVCRITK